MYIFVQMNTWGYGSVGRVSRSQCEGQGFESPYLHQMKSPRVARVFYLVAGTGGLDPELCSNSGGVFSPRSGYPLISSTSEQSLLCSVFFFSRKKIPPARLFLLSPTKSLAPLSVLCGDPEIPCIFFVNNKQMKSPRVARVFYLVAGTGGLDLELCSNSGGVFIRVCGELATMYPDRLPIKRFFRHSLDKAAY